MEYKNGRDACRYDHVIIQLDTAEIVSGQVSDFILMEKQPDNLSNDSEDLLEVTMLSPGKVESIRLYADQCLHVEDAFELFEKCQAQNN